MPAGSALDHKRADTTGARVDYQLLSVGMTSSANFFSDW
jgi:hypothetical protein